MRKTLGVCVVVGAVALLGMGLLRELGSSEADTHGAAARAPVAWMTRTTPPLRADVPGGGRSIRGVAVDERGRPVAGARISASWPIVGETLSELPCPPELWSASERLSSAPKPDLTLLACLPRGEDIVVEMLAARQGEAPVHAETTSAADGTFTLEGLPEGPHTLWALGERHAGTRLGVPAGSQDVEVTMSEAPSMRGVVLGDGAPLPDARVTYVPVLHTRFFDTSTDAQGRFELGPLPSSDTLVFITHDGWLPLLTSASRSGREQEFKLERPHRLAGRVLSQGVPVAGLEVTARQDAQHQPRVFSRATDEQGRFSFELAEGTYTLRAERDGEYALTRVELGSAPADDVILELGSALFVEGTVLDTARAPIGGALVQAHGSERYHLKLEARTTADGRYRMGPVEDGSTWDFTVEATGYLDKAMSDERKLTRGMPPQDFVLRRASSVVGRVMDTQGQPLEGIHLRLEMEEDTDTDAYEPQEDTYSKADGTFVLDATRSGRYTVHVDDERFVGVSQDVTAPSRDVELRLDMGATVVASVVDERGLPRDGFLVDLWPLPDAPGGERGEALRLGRSDARGQVTRQGIKPGRYMAVATQYTDGVDRQSTHEVTVERTATAKVELRLEQELSLKGTVVDDSGRPVRDAAVQATLMHDTPEPWAPRNVRTCGNSPPRGVHTDTAGRFDLRKVPRGRYRLDVEKEGYWFLPERSTGILVLEERPRIVINGASESISRPQVVLDEAKEVTLVMERRSHAKGTLVLPDGSPARAFSINGQEQTSSDGTFSHPVLAMDAPMPLVFEVDGFPSVARAAQADPSRADIDLGVIRLSPSRVITGHVLDLRTGAPIPSAFVAVVESRLGLPDEDPLLLSASETDAQGQFSISASEEGPVTLRVTQEDRYLPARLEVAPGTTKVRVLLDAGATLQFSATSRARRPVAGTLRLTALDTQGHEQRYEEFDEGRGEVRGMPAGRYRATFLPSPPDGDEDTPVFHDQTIEVPATGVLVVAFQEAQRGATVKLRAPMKGVYLALVSGEVGAPRDAEGLRQMTTMALEPQSSPLGEEVVYKDVPPGRYTVFGWKLVFGEGTFLREELEVPATGEVSRAIPATWRTLDVASR
ncbi:carboxypeptidase regulatory-like domain-containing protein [Myxococcus stipitatus]|uniref:carboxypeptidase regulatory-like domain-containing protein n=1 Tax=Myxococcus stipitatus TaxID=83455 RepID=UPI001F2D84A2|nr:carboxypeptidase regulatory-like domain-containing protein [Myxococcus stipitatus]MCE9668605.1 carboxypeptidase regulatory-like domain-containing protein [Myxococcus stipitatus]